MLKLYTHPRRAFKNYIRLSAPHGRVKCRPVALNSDEGGDRHPTGGAQKRIMFLVSSATNDEFAGSTWDNVSSLPHQYSFIGVGFACARTHEALKIIY